MEKKNKISGSNELLSFTPLATRKVQQAKKGDSIVIECIKEKSGFDKGRKERRRGGWSGAKMCISP